MFINGLLKGWSEFLARQLPRPKKFTMVMTESEKDFLHRYLRKSKNYLEFGTGGSTIFALLKSKATVHSVDTSRSWMNHMKSYRVIRRNLGKRLHLHYVNIGPTGNWGTPTNKKFAHRFPRFSQQIFDKIDPSQLDVVLVDGRFRVACALNTALHCHGNPNLRILVHDYGVRPEYFILEKYLKLEDAVDNLYMFKLRPEMDLAKIREVYNEYKFNPA